MRTPLNAWAAGALLVAVLLLAACDPAAPSAPAAAPMPGMSMPTGMSVPSAATAPGTDSPVAADTVRIENFAYSPARITVKVGTTVTWTNADADPHTVTSGGAAGGDGPLRSATLSQGGTYRYTFSRPGQFDYLCTIHPFMTATVVVTP